MEEKGYGNTNEGKELLYLYNVIIYTIAVLNDQVSWKHVCSTIDDIVLYHLW